MSQSQINRMVITIILCAVILLAALGACVAGWWRGVVDPSARPAPTPARPSVSDPLFQGSEVIFGNGPQGLGGVLAPLAGTVLPQLNPVQLIGAVYWGIQDATRWVQTLVAVILFALGLFSEVFSPPRDLDKLWVVALALATVVAPHIIITYLLLLVVVIFIQKIQSR